jgi:probable F420-dependent oxidoreductase
MQLPDHTRESRNTLGPDKALNVVLPCVMTTNADAAREAGRRALSIYLPLPAYQRRWVAQGFDETDWAGRGSDRLIDAFIAWGDRDAILERVEQHIEAGATQVQLGVNNAGGPGSGLPWDLLKALAPTDDG